MARESLTEKKLSVIDGNGVLSLVPRGPAEERVKWASLALSRVLLSLTFTGFTQLGIRIIADILATAMSGYGSAFSRPRRKQGYIHDSISHVSVGSSHSDTKQRFLKSMKDKFLFWLYKMTPNEPLYIYIWQKVTL